MRRRLIVAVVVVLAALIVWDDYMPVCKWRGRAYGDGVGASYVLVDGVKVLEW